MEKKPLSALTCRNADSQTVATDNNERTLVCFVDWTAAFRKMGELESEAWDWTAEAKSINAQVLLIFADADSMTGEHIVLMYRAFGGFQRDASFDGSLRPAAKLAILPGKTHYDIMEAGEVADLVENFLKQL